MRNIINSDFVKKNWRKLTITNLPEINKTYLTLHHAAQFIAIAGKYLLPQRDDDSNTNLEWLPDKKMLVSNLINCSKTFRVGLDLEKLELVVFDYNQQISNRFELNGKTNNIIFAWLKDNLSKLHCDTENLSMDIHYELPEHFVENNKPYILEGTKYFQEISNYFFNAGLILKQCAANFLHSSDIRCWPHHFDIATLIMLEKDKNGQMIKTMGVGFAPADIYVNGPYFYLNNWSENGNDLGTLPDLDGCGYWHTKDWTGAILKISELVKVESANEQADRMIRFINSAISSTLKLLKTD